MPTSWKNGALPRMSSRKKIADYFGITVEELMGTKKEPAGMGELDKQMQEIVALPNSATRWKRCCAPGQSRSESADKRQICFGRGFGQEGQNLGDQIRVLPQDSKDLFICHHAKTLFFVVSIILCYNSYKCSATSFLRNWDSILEKKRANLRSISEPARLRQPPPRSTGAAHARGRAQSIREERRIAAPPVLFALLWVRLLPALYGPFCGPLRPFGGCPWGVTPPARECLPPAPPDTRRRG